MATGKNERNQGTVADLSREARPDTIILADGNEYRLAPLDLNMLCEVRDLTEDYYGKDNRPKELHIIRATLFVRLKANHPEMTLEQAGKLVTPAILKKVLPLLKES